ncbi:hypothetical protein ACHAXT_012272 [Thalassiosira profunda]
MEMERSITAAASSEKRRRLQRMRSMRGSRKGYSADTEDPPACELEAEAAAAGSRHSRVGFYSHVRPRRRRRVGRDSSSAAAATPGTDPEIDLSLVSLLSSKELDRRFGVDNYESSSPSTSPSSSDAANDSSSGSESPSGRVSEAIIKKDKGRGALASSRPLAVVDYGSIELDMSGSLLDSIYKIGGSGGGGSGDLIIGGRRYSLNDNDRKGNEANPAMSVASSRSPEVESVIASLKNMSRATRAPSYLEGPEPKKRKPSALPVVDKLSTSLEECLSFSPFARVLFCAQHPYTVVHNNAAYSALAQQGLLLPCSVGDSFASSERRGEESPEEHIARAAAEHVAAFSPGHNFNADASSIHSRRQSGVVGTHRVHIFPVVSNDEACSQFVRSYKRNHLQRCSARDPSTVSSKGLQDPKESQAGKKRKTCTQYRSHYLLQIEPRSVQLS